MSRVLCGYTLPGGDHSYYVLYAGGFVWLADWVQSRILRFNPADRQLAYWSSPAISEPRGLAVDASGNIWWADIVGKKLGRLESSANRLTTYDLPENADAYMVAVANGKLWYTAQWREAGSVGIMDPAVAAGNSSTKNPVTSTSTETCRSLGEGTTSPVAIEAKSLSRGGRYWTEITPANVTGWRIFEVGGGGMPYGVLAQGNIAWVTDQLYQRLARIDPDAPPPTASPTPTATLTRTPTRTPTPTVTPTSTNTPSDKHRYLPLVRKP